MEEQEGKTHHPIGEPNSGLTGSQRFSYVRYDETSKAKQEEFRGAFQLLETMGYELLPAGRAQSLFMTALEEAYMWTGKAIRDEQIARGVEVANVPERTNG